jgi:hypothetical protein
LDDCWSVLCVPPCLCSFAPAPVKAFLGCIIVLVTDFNVWLRCVLSLYLLHTSCGVLTPPLPVARPFDSGTGSRERVPSRIPAITIPLY